jgi:hypothetical protein
MRAPRFTLIPLLLLAVASLLSACGPKATDYNQITRLPDPNRSLIIHLTGGDDPSNLIGRFIPDDMPVDQVNASVAMQTRCSQYIKPRISNSSVERDEVFEESSGIKAAGSTPTVKANAGASGSEVARVQYDIRRIMDAEIADQAAFSQCCAQAPDQCTKRYIGRFVFGSGQIFQQAGAAAEFGGGIAEIKQLDLDAKWGFAWEKATKFKDIYFGFELTQVANSGADVCATDWTRKVPTSLDGLYFVGTSNEAAQAADAKRLSETNANESVVKYLFGEYLSSATQINSDISDGLRDSSIVVNAASKGSAKRVRVMCYSDVKVGPAGEATMSALAYLPNAEAKAATADAIDAALSTLPPADPQRKTLEDAKSKLNAAP